MFWKLGLPVLVTFVAGVIVLLEFFLNVPVLKTYSSQALNWNIVVAAFASALGAANLLRIHVRRAQAADVKQKILSALLLVTLVLYSALGIIQGPQGKEYQYFFRNLLTPLSATMFSLNAFFIASAAYRAFRIRTAQAAVLLVTSFIVMLGNTGVGEAIWSGIPQAKVWVMNVLNTAGMRGIIIGSALGAIAISIRVLTGLERGHLGGAE